MSAATTRDFRAALRRVGSGLGLPLPHRVRILRELSYDLQELHGRLVAEGLPDEEAHRRATEVLVPDGDALRQLDRLHTPLYRRATRSVPPDRLRLVERGALALVTAAVLLVEGLALRSVDLFADPSPWLAPVLVSSGVIFALVAAKAFQLFVKGDHGDLRRGLRPILAAAAVTLGLGWAGLLTDLLVLASTLEASPEATAALLPVQVQKTAVLLTTSALTALAGGLGWFVLKQWVFVAEGAQAEILGIPFTPTRNEETER